MGWPFDACRTIPASVAAQHAGFHFKQSGKNLKTNCPFHHDKTPSLYFYPNGRFYCFSCHSGGDAVAFYSSYYKLSPVEAARKLAGEFGFAEPNKSTQPMPRRPDAHDLMQEVDAWKSKEWHRLCAIKHQAEWRLGAIEELLGSPDSCWESDFFCQVLEARDAAELGLDLLTCATPAQLLHYATGGDPD